MKLSRWLYRKWLWLYRKIVRENATPEYIARGWAIGMFWGCFSPFGAQLIFSIPSAFLLKGSKIGATLGTLLTNHFTIFFIYPAQVYVGSRLIGKTITYGEVCSAMEDVLREQSYAELMKIGGELVASFFIGGALLTAVMTPLTYFVVRGMVRKYREQREAKLRRRAAAGSSSSSPER